MNMVYVVTASETSPSEGSEVRVEVFAHGDDAVNWIEQGIARVTEENGLDESAVDGWFVEVHNASHTIQYDIKERDVK